MGVFSASVTSSSVVRSKTSPSKVLFSWSGTVVMVSAFKVTDLLSLCKVLARVRAGEPGLEEGSSRGNDLELWGTRGRGGGDSLEVKAVAVATSESMLEDMVSIIFDRAEKDGH